ncbi:hypothetical protein JCM3775_003028 [Rhodotorula graminis]|uniref:Uncharacterized protein n=1 Tax=Rhodotorula graminis (strain WP1) TaxID=578459 RepID=A0A194S7A3_RHOGW|nr:uncharacterized protein RHOBADRAFT_42952 [Rhodotorula graminis WP1]KPV76608.1 hypothetical protein RHOBADRAFT_42952 [Rhodotorula graminis WP1]
MSHLYSPTELTQLRDERWPLGDDWADWVGTAEKLESDALRNPNIAADSDTGEVNRAALCAFVDGLLDNTCAYLFSHMNESDRHNAIDSIRSYHDILVNWPAQPSLRQQLTNPHRFLATHVHGEDVTDLVRRAQAGAYTARRQRRGMSPAPASAARAAGAGPRSVPVSRAREGRPAGPGRGWGHVQRRARRVRLRRYKGLLVDSEGWPSGHSWADYIRTAEIVVNDALENDHIGAVPAHNDAITAWVLDAVEPGYDRRTLFDRLPELVRSECILSLRNVGASLISYSGGDLRVPSQRNFVDDKARSVGLDPAVNAHANRDLTAYQPRARSRSLTPVPQQRSRSATRPPVPSHVHPEAHAHHAHASSSRQPTLSPDPLDLGDFDHSWQHDPAQYSHDLDDPEFDLDALLDSWTYGQ